ncbi:MAG: alpha/beta fold hydrolase [Treponema sp.]|nr:alpha/beta fold hydrolase [Treponema sp.]
MKKNITKIIPIITLLCLFFSGCTIIVLELFADVFGRVEGNPSLHTWINDYPREEVSFYSGNNKLQGFIYGADNDKGLVVISHGIQSYADEYDRIITYLVNNGWRIFSFNNTGVDGSEGSSMIGLSQGLIDLNAALNYIYSQNVFDDLPIMIAGFSLGGYSACAVLNYEHRVNAVVSFAGFNSTREVSEYQATAEIGGIYYLFSPQVWVLEKQLFGDTANFTAIDGINKSQIPVMIVHCSNDNVIPVNSVSIYSQRSRITNPHVKIVYLDGEDAFGHYFKYYPKEELYEQVHQFFENSR